MTERTAVHMTFAELRDHTDERGHQLIDVLERLWHANDLALSQARFDAAMLSIQNRMLAPDLPPLGEAPTLGLRLVGS